MTRQAYYRNMLERFGRFVAVGLQGAFYLGVINANAESLPDWFTSERPFALHEAWKRLSSPDSVVYLCCNSNVMAGILRDMNGNAVTNTPLELTKRYGRGGKFVIRVRTDENGYFLIYSPPDALFTGVEGHPFNEPLRIYAIPGYPYSAAAFDFAAEKRGYRQCTVKLLRNDPGRRFYELTCSTGPPFENEELQNFLNRMARERKEIATLTAPASLEPRTGPTERRKRTEYQIKLVTESGEPLSSVIVRYDAYDGYAQNPQTVVTDAAGDCTVEEYLLENKDAEYHRHIKRGLHVDVPGGVSGPLRVELSPGKTNVFVVPRPGTISGKIPMEGSTPILSATMAYPEFFLMSYSAESAPILPDGSFTFRRAMPNEKVRIGVRWNPWHRSSTPRLHTAEVVVRPGESRSGVDLFIPHGAALTGIVLDKKGRPVTEKLDVRRSGYIVDTSGNWFMAAPLAGRNRITVTAEGYEPYETEIEALKPGELRFLRVELKGDGPAQDFKELFELLHTLTPNAP